MSTRTLMRGTLTLTMDTLTNPLQYGFMQRALVEVVLMGIVTGAIGTYVVLRGLAFIGDALSHAIFPGVVVAFLLDRSIFAGALFFGVLTSVGIGVIAKNQRVREDSAIGVLFVGAFALGVVLISSTRNFARDLASFLFGNVLSVSESDIIISALVGAAVLATLILLHQQLLAASFDRLAAQAMGLPVFWLDILLLVLISLTIVVSLRAVGNILVVAMLVTPPATARLFTDRLPHTMALSALLGASAGVIGLYISYYQDVAAGGTIVLVSTAAFVTAWLFSPSNGMLATRILRRPLVVAGGEPEAQVVLESPEIRSHER